MERGEGAGISMENGDTHSPNSPLARKLLDGYQRGFPLVERPYAAIGAEIGFAEADVISAVADLLAGGELSRVGAVLEPGRAGVSTLAAMAVPAGDLEQTAAMVSAFPEVNHCYERDHALNIWFVVTAPDAARLDAVLLAIERRAGIPVLDLPMEEPYHLDLGFPIRWPT